MICQYQEPTPLGNRRSRDVSLSPAVPGFGNQDFGFDANDRLAGAGNESDANGNTLVGGIPGGAVAPSSAHKDQYDYNNRLIRRSDGATTITLVYDGDGNRVRKTVSVAGGSTTTTFFVVDTQNPTGYAQVLEEWQTADGGTSWTQTRSYLYGHDLVSQQRFASGAPTGTDYYGYDGHGNVRFLIDPSGAITDTYSYDAFGTLIDSSGTTANRYLYCGEQWDADLGFYHLRARYLNPDSGRFWTQDTYEGNSSDPLSLHKYLYAHANPVMNVDPSGQFISMPTTLGAITIAGTLTALNVAIISQVSVNYQKFFGLSSRERAQAVQRNNRTVESLKRIIDSHGERTFQEEQLGVVGTMGTRMPGDSAFQRAVNLFESLRNIEGYPSALEELFARLGNRGIYGVPLPDDQTADQRAELAKALLNRQEAFDRWLRRDY